MPVDDRVPDKAVGTDVSVIVYDDGRRMWADLRAEWEQTQADLILPGGFSRQRFLRAGAGHTVWTDRVITLRDLWLNIAGYLATLEEVKLPKVLKQPEDNRLLAEIIAEIPVLKPLIRYSSGFEIIDKQLSWIEKQADLDYLPQTELEKGLQELRQRLEAAGVSLQDGRRSLLARNAKLVELRRPVLFAPLPEVNRQAGGLLKGLARQNQVRLYLLSAPAVVDTYLHQFGLDSGATVTKRFDENGRMSVLFDRGSSEAKAGRGEQSLGKPDPGEISWLVADDQMAAAVEMVHRWIEAGADPEKTAIIAPNVENCSNAVARAAAMMNVPVLVREMISTNESLLGSLLLMLSRSDLSSEILIVDGDARALGLGEEQLEALRHARAEDSLAELKALFGLGRQILEHLPENVAELEPEWSWLDSLEKAIAHIEEIGTIPLNLPDLIRSIGSTRKERGRPRGVALVSYAEAPALEIDNACIIDLDAMPPKPPSPFVSEALLEVCPQMEHPDTRPQLVAATAAAQRLCLVRPRHSGRGPVQPDPFWTETLRAWGGEETELSDDQLQTPRHALRSRARRKETSHDRLQAALRQIDRERLGTDIGTQTRRSYSVTELESYIRCPYGWFIAKVLQPLQRPTSQAIRGTQSHGLLDAIFRENVQADEIDELVAQLAILSEREQKTMTRQLQRIQAAFGGSPEWPFPEHHCEVSLNSEVSTDDGDLISLRGTADRIDLRAAHDHEQAPQMLVIDYKSNNPPSFTSKGILQPYLYPMMAAQKYAAEPRGFIYVSVRYARYSACLTNPINGLPASGETRCDWQSRSRRASREALEAIENIENGRWSEIGKSCPPYCPHRLLSETGLRN